MYCPAEYHERWNYFAIPSNSFDYGSRFAILRHPKVVSSFALCDNQLILSYPYLEASFVHVVDIIWDDTVLGYDLP